MSIKDKLLVGVLITPALFLCFFLPLCGNIIRLVVYRSLMFIKVPIFKNVLFAS